MHCDILKIKDGITTGKKLNWSFFQGQVSVLRHRHEVMQMLLTPITIACLPFSDRTTLQVRRPIV